MLMRTRRIVDSAKALPVLVEQMDVCLCAVGIAFLKEGEDVKIRQ